MTEQSLNEIETDALITPKSPTKCCFICFEDIQSPFSSESNAENSENRENRLKMTECGCSEYVHPRCIGQWLESNYEDYVSNLQTNTKPQIRCPICNTNGSLQSPEPLLSGNFASLAFQRFFARIQRNQTQHFNQLLLINPFHPRNAPNNNQIPLLPDPNGHPVDMRRFIVVSCAMLSMAFILLWILFIFDVSTK